MSSQGGYNGNPNLPKAGSQYNLTPEQIVEFKKCMDDPVYFAENYFKIVHIDHGLIPFKLYDFQREAVKLATENRKYVLVTGRQMGKTSIATVIILHYALFNEDKTIALLANKGDMAREILSRVQLAYEYLPLWLKVGVKEWNKGSVEFDNGTKIIAAASSSSAIRGRSCVAGSTKVTTLNNGIIKESRIDEVSYTRDMLILSDGAFRRFDGIKSMGTKKVGTLTLLDGRSIVCTPDHEIKTQYGWIEAQYLDHNYICSGSQFVSYTLHDTDIEVYDAINVNETSSFTANGIEVHNCSMVYIDECVTGDTLVTIRNKETGEVETIDIDQLNSRL